MKTYLGVDLGTSSIKLTLVDSLGNIIKEVSREYPIYQNGLNSEQNPTDWWDAFNVALEDLLEDQDRSLLTAMSFSGQMHGLVMLDEKDNVIRPCILWNDGRSYEEVNYLNNVIGKDKLNEYTGNIAYAGFTLPKLLWVRNNETDNFNKINKIMLPKDYLVYRLTDKFVSDYSDASGTLFLDCKNKKYNQNILDLAGISIDLLPELHESYDVIGVINNEFKTLHKLNDVKVIMGAGDNACASIGMGVINEGELNISLGTSGTIFIPTDNFVSLENNELHSFASVTGKWHLMGCILTAASARKWWLEEILQTSDYNQDEIDVNNSIDEDLLFLPYLSGERSPHNDVNAKGAFVGLKHTTSKGDMSKAIMEGVAFALRDCLEIARSNGYEFTKASICGGGSNSDYWVQTLSNVLNLPITKNDGSPSLGAALIAIKGDTNVDFDSLTKETVESNQFYPIKTQVEKLDIKYNKFKKLYPLLKQI